MATAATLATYLALADVVPVAWVLGLSCALLETLVFYGLALLRERKQLEGLRRARRAAGRVLREFGAAELADLALRPTLMVLGASTARPWGVVLGSIVADVVFYAIAATSRPPR